MKPEPKKNGGARPGAGRPRTGEGVRVTIRLPESVAAAVNADRAGAKLMLLQWSNRQPEPAILEHENNLISSWHDSNYVQPLTHSL